jgi:ABC-type multidrug transport system ATPase subunit
VTIILDNVGKKFNREWIFRNLNYVLSPAEKLVILGGNGSGKSTLLQVISGFITPNEGSVSFKKGGEIIAPEKMKDQVSFASPYLQLVEDYTAGELAEHMSLYKKFVDGLDPSGIIEIAGLGHAKDKYIRQYSSGMKQRLKLALAMLAEVDCVLLDEPLSNLDSAAINWYRQMVEKYLSHRSVIVCSNAIAEEYFFCTRQLSVTDFK